MKPAPFAYFAPDSLDRAIELLEQHADAKILAGGQSLVPTMNFRLARPSVLVDINRIAGLDFVEPRNGSLEIGALARHARFETPVAAGRLGTSLAQIARYVGHHPIRVRGTFIGSLAHADPAAEWCVVASTLDATMVAHGPAGVREIPAVEFFETMFSTSLQENEVLGSARLPLLRDEHRAGFAEFARRAGDFALVMAMVVLTVRDGIVSEARIGIGGVADRPVRAHAAEAAVTGLPLDGEIAHTAAAAAAESITPLGDIHGSTEYRTDLIRAMVRRATQQAVAS